MSDLVLQEIIPRSKSGDQLLQQNKASSEPNLLAVPQIQVAPFGSTILWHGSIRSINKFAQVEKTADAPEPLQLRRKLIVMCLALGNLGSTMAFSILAPFFPAVAATRGATQTQIGIIFGSFNLFMFVCSPLFGRFISQIGAKFMLVSGLVIAGTTCCLFGIMHQSPKGETFFGLCLLLRLFEAIGCAAFNTASLTIIAFEFPQRVSSFVGFLELFAGLGFSLGPPLGGALYELGGFGLPFFVLGGVQCFVALVAFCLVPPPKGAIKASTASYKALLLRPRLYFVLTIIMVVLMSVSFLDPMLEPFLHQFNLNSFQVGLMFLCMAGPYTLSAPFIGHLIDNKLSNKYHIILVIGASVSAVAYLGLGPAPFFGIKTTLLTVGISLAVAGSAIAPVFIPTYKQCIEIARNSGYPDDFKTYGIVSGVFQAAIALGAFVGPLYGGVSSQHVGFEWSCTIIAMLFISLIVLSFIDKLVSARQMPLPDITIEEVIT